MCRLKTESGAGTSLWKIRFRPFARRSSRVDPDNRVLCVEGARHTEPDSQLSVFVIALNLRKGWQEMTKPFLFYRLFLWKCQWIALWLATKKLSFTTVNFPELETSYIGGYWHGGVIRRELVKPFVWVMKMRDSSFSGLLANCAAVQLFYSIRSLIRTLQVWGD